MGEHATEGVPTFEDLGPCPATGLRRARRAGWRERVGRDLEVEVTLLGERLLHVRSAGEAAAPDITRRAAVIERARSEAGLEAASAGLVLDFSGLGGATLGARRAYVAWLRDALERYGLVTAYGVRPAMRPVVRLGRALSPAFSAIEFHEGYGDAARGAARALGLDVRADADETPVANGPTESGEETRTEVAHRTAQLTRILSRMTLVEDLGQTIPELPDDDPFAELFAAVAAVRDDLRAMVRLRDERAARLEESEARFRVVSESAVDAIVTIDDEGVIRYANPAMAALFGYALDELLGRPMSDLVPEALRDAHRAGVERYVRTRARHIPWDGIELPGLHRDGRQIPCEVTFGESEIDGRPVFTGILRDITARKEIAAALERARDEALEASRLKSEFLATMSHEIRTPMNGILGFSELLEGTELDEQQREHLGVIRHEAEALLGILNDILDFSRIEAGRMRLHPAPFTPRALASRLESLVAPRAAEKGLSLRVVVDDAVPSQLLGDAPRLRQVLLNLLDNAVKFTERGEVALTVERMPDGEREDEGRTWLRFAVRDTGVGIASDEVERLFERFTQADSSARRSHGGTGLGLAITRGLVELLGGSLDLTSAPGRGSTFIVELPFATPEAPVTSTQDSSSSPEVDYDEGEGEGEVPPPSRGHVLVVEDNPTNRRLAELHLAALGYAFTSVDGGEAAVAACAEGGFDAVLMDCHMPGLDGFAATERIRDAERAAGDGRHVPIVALTASAMRGDRERCLAAGMDDYLSKPFRREELAMALERLVGEAATASGDAAPQPRPPAAGPSDAGER